MSAITDVALLDLGCPPDVLDEARQFHILAVARLGGDDAAEVDARMVLVECFDEPFTVTTDGSCYDSDGKLDPEVMHFAALVYGGRHLDYGPPVAKAMTPP